MTRDPSDPLQIVIVGAGRHSREVHSYLLDLALVQPGLRIVGHIDEGKPRGDADGIEIVGGIEDLDVVLRSSDAGTYRYITALGDNHVRRALAVKVEARGAPGIAAWSLIHPRAYVGARVEIGEGTCIAPGSVVTTRVRIGRHCILNVKSSVSHDCNLGDFVNVNPGVTICGDVTIGEGAYIGAGATVIDKVSIGAGAVIGAGAAVIRNIPPNVTAVGVPARVIKENRVRF